MSDSAHSDRAAWIRAAVEQFEAPLVRYAMQLVGNVESAREVVQDTFLRLWNDDLAALESRLAPWLFTVCRNRALDVRKKEQRMTAMTGVELEMRDHLQQDPTRNLEISELAEHVIELVEELPGNQREVLRLKFQAGLSYKEISKVTQLSVSNVGYLLHTAIKRLREQLKTSESVK